MNTTPVTADPGPRTIDVTGLTPDAVRVVADVVNILRGQQSQAEPAPIGPPPNETAEEWIARFKAWTSRQPVRSITVDDSRESIYGTTPRPLDQSTPEWAVSFRAWCASQPRVDGPVDLIRDAIYEEDSE